MANLIVDYRKYVDKINLLENQLKQIRANFEKDLLMDIENEFSKYLKKVDLSGQFNMNYNTRFTFFLLEENYGISINVTVNEWGASVLISPIYKKYGFKKYFSDSRSNWNYSIDTNHRFVSREPKPIENISSFVKKVVDSLKKKNEQRKIEIEKRDLKRATKKYNL